MAISSFIVTAVGISLSGVMAPGPITAATLAAGTRHRHAGALIALGHVVVELPLMLLLVAGAGALLKGQLVRAGIGAAGGSLLLLLGIQLLVSLRKTDCETGVSAQRHPFWTGVILTGANPYFLVWWATVGLALTGQALEIGLLALVLFAAIHWLCDLGWLEVLSLAGFRSSQAFGQRSQRIVSAVCGGLLLVFGAKFLWDAGRTLFGFLIIGVLAVSLIPGAVAGEIAVAVTEERVVEFRGWGLMPAPYDRQLPTYADGSPAHGDAGWLPATQDLDEQPPRTIEDRVMTGGPLVLPAQSVTLLCTAAAPGAAGVKP